MNRIRTICLGALSLWLCAPTGNTGAEEPAFDPGATIRAAVAQLQRWHLRPKRLNDELSRKWLGAFLARLDPHRMYFRQSDVEEFRRVAGRLDELAKEGDFRFPELVRERYRKRVEEAASCAEEFVSLKHDYSLDEEFPTRFDAYPANREEVRDRWRLRLKAELLIEKAHGRPPSEVRSQLSGRYRRIARQAREMTDERLCQIYLDSLAATYDPHSGYLSPTLMRSFNQTVTIRTYTLGLGLRQRAGQFAITSLHPSLRDSTTRRSLVGWHLTAIRRLEGTTFDLVEVHPDDLRNMIRRPSGPLESDTEVILELINPVTSQRLTITWCRFPSF